MHARIFSTLAAIAALLVTAAAWADGCPHCQNGCCDEVTYRCKMVPDVKPIKKIVYECKEVPYCQHKLPKFGHCDCCPECKACPKFKKVLIKREIICGETCGTKCVVEEIRNPCRHCGNVPCDQAPAAAGPQPTNPAPPMPVIDNAAKAKPAFFVPPVVSVSRPKSQRISD